MNLDIANGAVLARLQVTHDTRLAERVEALDDGRRVDEVPAAQHAHQMGVQLRDFDPGGPVHFAGGAGGSGGRSRRGTIGAAKKDNES